MAFAAITRGHTLRARYCHDAAAAGYCHSHCHAMLLQSLLLMPMLRAPLRRLRCVVATVKDGYGYVNIIHGYAAIIYYMLTLRVELMLRATRYYVVG